MALTCGNLTNEIVFKSVHVKVGHGIYERHSDFRPVKDGARDNGMLVSASFICHFNFRANFVFS